MDKEEERNMREILNVLFPMRMLRNFATKNYPDIKSRKREEIVGYIIPRLSREEISEIKGLGEQLKLERENLSTYFLEVEKDINFDKILKILNNNYETVEISNINTAKIDGKNEITLKYSWTDYKRGFDEDYNMIKESVPHNVSIRFFELGDEGFPKRIFIVLRCKHSEMRHLLSEKEGQVE